MEDDKLLAQLRRFLSYDPRTGQFRWRIQVGSRGNVGSIAGCHTGSDRGYIPIGYTDSEGVRHLFRAHQLALWFQTGKRPREVDHRDRDKANTKLRNLREATTQQNRANRDLLRNNTSKKTGVTWCASRQKWQAQINIGDRCIFLGRYDRYDDAVVARRAAELEFFGEYCPS